MAKGTASLEKLKQFWDSEVMDEERWTQNSKLLRALGLFAASVFLMRSFGEQMAI